MAMSEIIGTAKAIAVTRFREAPWELVSWKGAVTL